VLFVLDPEATAVRVAQDDYACPDSECSGLLRPWGSLWGSIGVAGSGRCGSSVGAPTG
jgi:hypothetical protein